jgi:polysaccharide pyruvyl transferase WcaK-like protein
MGDSPYIQAGHMKKKFTILIPNATSPRNVGNQAIMSVLVSLLKKSYPNCRILMQGFDPHLQKDPVDSVRHSLYSWAVFANKNPFVRTYRMFMIILGIAGFPYLPLELSKIFREYKEADLVVLEAGGYLTTRPGFSQTLNFFMQLLPVYLSIKLHKRVIQSPFSVGPFAYPWQEYLVGRLFKHVDRVFTREDISYELLERNGVHAQKSADLVFFSQYAKKTRGKNKRAIGIVMRQCQKEEHVAHSIAIFAKKYRYSVVPIVQCHAREYKDFDKESVLRVSQMLKAHGVDVHPLQIITTPGEARKTYASLSMMVSFRMHAALFALMEGVPAIVISDEVKAKGIFHTLGIPELVLSLKGLTISDSLEYIGKNKKRIQRTVKSSIKKIRKNKPRLSIDTVRFERMAVKND